MIKNIGIFGGTFDPIHIGHITPIQTAAKLLNLTTINIIPANIPPHKSQPYSTSEHRAAMVKLVCEQVTLFHFDDRELKREKPSFTLDTLKEIHAETNNTENQSRLFFFIGMDSLINFTRWHCWQDILTLCHLVVLPRPGYQINSVPEELQTRLQVFEKNTISQLNITLKSSSTSGLIYLMPDKLENISSTEIRQHIAQNKCVQQWLLPNVYQYIKKHQLY